MTSRVVTTQVELNKAAADKVVRVCVEVNIDGEVIA
jgi:hypothetical protein